MSRPRNQYAFPQFEGQVDAAMKTVFGPSFKTQVDTTTTQEIRGKKYFACYCPENDAKKINGIPNIISDRLVSKDAHFRLSTEAYYYRFYVEENFMDNLIQQQNQLSASAQSYASSQGMFGTAAAASAGPTKKEIAEALATIFNNPSFKAQIPDTATKKLANNNDYYTCYCQPSQASQIIVSSDVQMSGNVTPPSNVRASFTVMFYVAKKYIDNMIQQSTAAPALPVLQSTAPRGKNKDLTGFTFMTPQDAQQFSQLLANAGINGRDGKPLTVQSNNVTVIVENTNLNIAKQCYSLPSPAMTYKK